MIGNLHRWFGLATLVLFMFTGQIMIHHQPPVADMEMPLRLLFRSRHIYVLLGGLVNLLVGLRYVLPAAGWRRIAALSASGLALSSAPLLGAAFFAEAAGTGRPGPLSPLGLVAAFLGACVYASVTWNLPPDGRRECRTVTIRNAAGEN
ncbi:MAG TPA: hypothetical protein VMH34_01715 [Gammaproteobacteria bacterium]|nr:hypothetical protein [Gammaproteobacteria bacterium]